MTDINNLKTITFTSCLCNSDNEPIRGTEREVCVLFNCTQISEHDVNELIDSGKYEFDARVIVTTPQQMSFLKDKN